MRMQREILLVKRDPNSPYKDAGLEEIPHVTETATASEIALIAKMSLIAKKFDIQVGAVLHGIRIDVFPDSDLFTVACAYWDAEKARGDGPKITVMK